MTQAWERTARAALAATVASATLGAVAQPADRTRPPVSAQTIQQKAAMLDKVLADSALIERVAASANADAQRHIASAHELLGHARLLAGADQLPAANALLNKAIAEISRAQQLAPDASAAKAGEEARYSRQLKEATARLAGQTLVYERRFGSPREEFEFELERHRSFERLVPLALAQFRPSAELRALVGQYVTQARLQRDRAEAAASHDPALALRHVTEGTESLRRALQAAGLSIPQTPSDTK